MANSDWINNVLAEIKEKEPIWDNWYLREKIGAGAFSEVYRAEAKLTNRVDEAAVKIEAVYLEENEFSTDENANEKLLLEKKSNVANEATIMKQLEECPYIVSYKDELDRPIYKNNNIVGYYFLIRMELLDNVFQKITGREFDFSEKNILKLAEEIGKGLDTAHKAGYIHRDIKPSNFFVSKNGTYKLGDFNIAKRKSTGSTFAGTEGYMAPEVLQVRYNNEKYTAQADIYSLGICLYQMMNGMKFPFEDSMSRESALNERLSGKALPAPSNASKEFSAIILKACEYDRGDRYASIEEMLKDIALLKENHFVPAEKKENNSQTVIDENLTQYAGPSAQYNNSTKSNFVKTNKVEEFYQEEKEERSRRKKVVILAISIVLIMLLVMGGIALAIIKSNDDSNSSGEDTKKHSSLQTPEPENTTKPDLTATPKPTATSTPKPTATSTPKPTATSTPKPTATSTPKPTATSTPEPTAIATQEPTATSTPEPTATATPEPTATATPTPTATATPKPTAGTAYSEGLTYVLEDEYYAVTGIGSFKGTDLVIPEYYNGKPVKKIAASAFKGNTNIKRVVIPSTIKEIGGNAFANCYNLNRIEYNAVSCQDCNSNYYPFSNAGSSNYDDVEFEIVIGAGVTKIPDYIFACVYATKVTFNGTSLTQIGYYAFYNCTRVKGRIVIPEGVLEIKSKAFLTCSSIDEVVIPSTVKIIGEKAFGECYRLKRIEYNAVSCQDCSSNYYPFSDAGSSNYDDVEFEIVIGAGVKKIPSYIFSYTYATKVTFKGNALTEIGSNAFYGCGRVKGTITIPEGTIKIGGYAFYSFKSLEKIIIPSTVKEMGEHAFAYCENLKSIEFNAVSCADCASNYTVFYNDGSNNYDDVVFEFIIGEKVTKIPNYLIRSTYVTKVTCKGANISQIGTYAFSNTSRLKEIVVKRGSYVEKWLGDNGLGALVTTE